MPPHIVRGFDAIKKRPVRAAERRSLTAAWNTGRQSPGESDVGRGHIEPNTLPDRTALGPSPHDPQVSGWKTGKWAVVVTTLYAGLYLFAMADFDTAA
jgi:hypothetical protein